MIPGRYNVAIISHPVNRMLIHGGYTTQVRRVCTKPRVPRAPAPSCIPLLENETIWLPADTPEKDVTDEIEQLIGRLNVPFKEVQVYRERRLFYKQYLEMPGSAG